MPAPLVSVIMPTRNRARRLLGEAIDSVLGQTLDDFELLIVDDASTDETPAVLAARAREDARLKVFRLAENGGDNVARNRALREVSGRYVALLDDDDLALPTRLERTVARLEAEPALDVVTTGFRFMDAAGRLLDYVPSQAPIGEYATDGATVFELLYRDWVWLPTCTLTFRAELVETLRYPEVRRCDGDSMFHCLLALSGASFARMPEHLAYIRRGDEHESMSVDRAKLFADRRQSLIAMRALLRERRVSTFDHLHGRAWSNHLLKEAAELGGLAGLARSAVAVWHWPGNPRARDYFFSWRARRAH